MINRVSLAFCIFGLLLIVPLHRTSVNDQTGFDLPQPNGGYAIGTRIDVLKDAHRSRDLLLTFWYPAAQGTAMSAPYMDKKTADALAGDWKLQGDFQRLVRTHARLSALFAEGGPFPVVLLEHGLAVVPAIYTYSR
jgi:hypothetical protein